MSKSLPSVLIHATLWWPLAARLAIRFRDLGCRVNSICPPVHPLHSVRGIERRYLLRSWRVQKSLIQAIDRSHADYIVPTDDRAVLQLHDLAASFPRYRELVKRSLGNPDCFAVVRSRTSLLALAKSLQIPTPVTVPLRSEREASDFAASWSSYPAVVKRDGTYGGRGVAVVMTPEELVNAYHRLRQEPSVLVKLKRRLVDDDVMAFYQPRKLPPENISMQSYVAGTPANAMYACFQGKLLATLQVRTICAQHATGAGLIVERMNDARIEDAGRELAQALSFSGFMGLDFLLESSSGNPYLLEMNPRATQLGHLPLENSSNGDNLAEALWLAWTDNGTRRRIIDAEKRRIPQRIAFYPSALELGVNNALLASAWLDRPDYEPTLVNELSKMGWPERSAVYRLFHRFYKVSPEKPVVFQDAGMVMEAGFSSVTRNSVS